MTEEITQTLDMGGVGEINGIQLRIVDTTPQITRNNPAVSEIAELFPKYGRLGQPYLINRIVNDDNFLNEIATDLMAKSMDSPEFRARYDEDDGSLFQNDFNRLKRNLRQNTLRGSLTGEDIRETIVNRDLQIRNGIQQVETPVVNYTDLPQFYQNLGGQESSWRNIDNVGFTGTPDSTATGVFQFLEGTWNDLVNKYGESHGLTREGRRDVEQQLIAGKLFTRDNARQLTNRGIDTTDANMYLAHFLGSNGAANFIDGLTENPEQNATNLVSRNVAESNRNVFFHDGDLTRPRTAQEVYERQTSRFGNGRTWDSDIQELGIQFTQERDSKPIYPLNEFRDIITKNPEVYARFGLVDERGNFVYGNRTDDYLAFAQEIENNPELQTSLFNDRFQNFQTELGRSHNLTSLVEADPNEKIKAFAIYDRYGKEGLTQYVNYLEAYNPDISFRNQDRKVLEAYRFLTSRGPDGITPIQWMQEFVGYEGSAFGEVEYTPITENTELQYLFPKGITPFSADFYDFDGEEFIRKSDTRIITSLFDKFNIPYNEDTIAETLRGTSEEFDDLKFQVARDVDLNDLHAILMANGEYDESTGRVRFLLNDFLNQPIEVRLAAEALLTMNNQKDLIYRVDDAATDAQLLGSQALYNPLRTKIESYDFAFEPDRFDQALEKSTVGKLATLLTKTERQPVYDDNGNIVGYAEQPVSSIRNSLIGVGLGTFNFINELFVRPVYEVKGFLNDNLNTQTGSDIFYERYIRENSLAVNAWREQFELGTMTGMTNMGTDLALFLAALGRYGRVTQVNMGKAVTSVGNMRNIANVERASAVAASVPAANKWVQYGNAIQQSAYSTSRKATGFRYLIGDVALNPMLPQEWSLIGSGLTDMAANYAGLSVENLEERYKRSNFFGRFFADAIANTIVGTIADGALSFIAATPKLFAKTTGSKVGAFGKDAWTRFETVQYVDLISSSVRTMPDEVATAAAKKGLLSIAKNPEQLTTGNLAEIVKRAGSPIANNLKNDIRAILSHYDEVLAGGVRKDLDSAVDRIYNEVLEDASTQITNMFRNGDETLNQGKLLSFADKLGEATTVVRTVEPTEELAHRNGKYTFEEALKLKGEADNRIVRADGDRYVVLEVDDDRWATDLASAIRRNAMEVTGDEVVALRSEGVGITTQAEITERVTEVFGTPIRVMDEGVEVNGYIMDVDNGLAMVKTTDGKTVTATASETSDALSIKFTRQFDNQEIGEERFAQLANKYFRATPEQADEVVAEAARPVATKPSGKQPTLRQVKEEAKIKENNKKAAQEKTQSKKAVKAAEQTKKVEPDTPPKIEERSEVNGLSTRIEKRLTSVLGKTPSVKEATNFFKNFGVDSLELFKRRFKKGKKLVRFLGDNIGPVKEYTAGTKIKKNIIVKVKELTGEDSYYIANKATELPPSRWIESTDGNLLPNPDWNAINVNRTIEANNGALQAYKQTPDGLWEKATFQDENQHFLNIQKAINATDEVSDMSMIPRHEVIANNYDAMVIMRDGKEHYQLVHESQAIATNKAVTENNYASVTKKPRGKKPSEKEGVKKILDETKEEANLRRLLESIDEESLERDKKIMASGNVEKIKELKEFKEFEKKVMEMTDLTGEQITKMYQDFLSNKNNIVPMFVGFSGSLLAGLYDYINEPDPDYTYAGLGIFASMFMGAGGVKRIADIAAAEATKVVRVAASTGTDPKYYDQTTKRMVEASSKFSKTADERAVGMVTPSANEAETRAFREQFLEPLVNSVKNFRSVDLNNASEWLRNNSYFTSSFSFMSKLSPTARRLRDILLPYDHEAKKMNAMFKTDFIKNMGGNANALREFNNNMNAKVAEKLRQMGGTDTDARAAYQEWNESFYRIVNSSAEIKDGVFVTNPNKQSIEELYNGNLGKYYKQLDEFLLNDKDFQIYMRSYRESMRKIKQDWLGIIEKSLKENFDMLGRSPVANKRQIQLLNRFVQTRQTSRQFAAGLDEGDQALFREIIKNSEKNGYEILKTIRDIHKSKKSFLDMGDSYIPQMYNRDKLENIKNRKMREFLDEGMDKTAASERVDEYLLGEFIRVNTSNKKVKQLSKYDPESGQLVTKTFKTQKAAEAELEKMFQNNPEFRTMMGDNLEGVIENFGEKQFRINLPQEVLDTVQRAEYRRLFDDFMVGSVIKNSNFLERPRKWDIPAAWAETDIDRVLYRYSQDAGPRMHMTKNGIWGNSDFNRIMTSIRTELAQGGVDSELINTYSNRITNIYNTQTGVLKNVMSHTNPSERLAELNRHMNFEKMSSTVRNLNFAAFGWKISILDTFQPFVLGPLLSSWNSVNKTTKLFVTNPQALKNAESLSEIHNLSLRKVEAFRPQNEFDFDNAAALGLRGTKRSKLQKFSDQGSDFVASFSLTKGAVWGLNKLTGNALGIDMANWGMARLAFNDFYGVNSISTTMNWFSGVLEAQGLAQIYRKFQQEGAPRVIDGLTRDEVTRKFIQVGIPEDRIASFVRDSDQFDNIVRAVSSDEPLNINMVQQNPRLYNDLQNIMETMTDAYHGKNKMFRPETWSTPWGRVISQFSVYPFNFALQNTQRRIFSPISSYNARLLAGDFGDSKKIGNFEVPRVLWHMSQGNFDQLSKMGFSKEAIDAFPIEAYTHIMRVMMATNIAAASFITRDAVSDIIEYPINEMAGTEQWNRLERRWVVNPSAPDAAKFTWGDLVAGSGMGPNEYFAAIRSYVGYMGTTGSLGLIDTMFMNEFAARDGISAYSITVSRASDLIKSVNTVTTSQFDQLPTTIADETLDFVLGTAPLLGSFQNGLRTGAEAMFNRAENNNVFINDRTTGQRVNPSDLFSY